MTIHSIDGDFTRGHRAFMPKDYLIFNAFLDSSTVFTRASIGTYNNSSFNLATAAVNIPRFEHNTVTGLLRGFLSTDAYTNLCTYSEDLSVWTTNGSPTIAKDATSPRGIVNDAYTIESSAAFTGKYRTFTGIAASTKYIISGIVENISGSGNVKVGADSAVFNTGQVATMNINASTGVITGTSGGVTDSGIYTRSDGSHQWWLEATTDAAVSSFALVNYNSSASASKNMFFGNMIVASNFLVPYILTNGSTATEAKDLVSIPIADFRYNQDANSFHLEVKTLGQGEVYGSTLFFVGDNTNHIQAYIHNSTGNVVFVMKTAGVVEFGVAIAASPHTWGDDLTVGYAYDADFCRFYINGVHEYTYINSITPYTMPTITGSLHLFSTDSGLQNGNMTCDRFMHQPRVLPIDIMTSL